MVKAADVTIRNSETGRIDVDSPEASLRVEDSLIDGGSARAPAIGYSNIYLLRVEIRGGQTSVLCSNCVVEQSWLHEQTPPVSDEHLGGYMSNGGSEVIIRGNAIECSPVDNDLGGGCSGSAQIYGDFAPLSDYVFEGNLFKATPGAYCTNFGYNPQKQFGSTPARITVRGNVFERGVSGKCGSFGPVTGFLDSGGNTWADNRWDDGSPVSAR